MENFSLFQLLILLFIFYPLIKRFIDGVRGVQEPVDQSEESHDPWSGEQYDQASREEMHRDPSSSHRREVPEPEPYSRRPPTMSEPVSDTASGRNKPGEQSWEDFFEGLEEILAGKEPHQHSETEHPSSHQPTGTTSRDSHRHAPSQTTYKPIPAPSDLEHADDYRHPSHGPVYGSSAGSEQRNTGAARSSASSGSASSQHRNQEYDSAGVSGDEFSNELTDTDNPIYVELDEAPEVTIFGQSGRKNVRRILHDPERIKDGILIKEILDKPRSRRAHPYRF